MKIGIVDLDTSHPKAWVPILQEMGHEVTAVYDGGTVQDEGAAGAFAEKHGIPVVCDRLSEMPALVDAAIIHNVNWDLHVERARPFAEAGKAILIDKPMAGSARDIRQLLEWSRGGVRIAGGSALRFCEEAEAWRRSHAPEDRVVTALAGCSVDDFNYGIHAYGLLLAIMGPGIASVRSAGVHIQHQIELVWHDGRRAFLSVGVTAGYQPFYATIVSEREVRHLQVDADRLYRSFLAAALPYLAGESTNVPPFPPLGELLEAELAALAARRSLLEGGRTVALDEAAVSSEPGYDGAAFAVQYRMKARGQAR
ncbi:Oxidoreductase family, NAD-binding Rossmann fold [Cohnella sp. OV330]|uniref:Gfo/Idh/MocA family oxidoreductase n=1 Tax=Cohnella sp. OV330 TaxID=1855288 RepID=UPI0008E64BA2|nr:Gfo/Idh/MocA family oxidoreductase [Cohnella sp. OV330]SFA73272.1 Oxidoreductase family, NAD-binding Rossmann fold [Cohnella sp. OV330]